jgi:hypothetical protein
MNLLWIELENSYILASGYDLFFITMNEPKKEESILY